MLIVWARDREYDEKKAMFPINATHMNVKSIVDAWKSSAAEAANWNRASRIAHINIANVIVGPFQSEKIFDDCRFALSYHHSIPIGGFYSRIYSASTFDALKRAGRKKNRWIMWKDCPPWTDVVNQIKSTQRETQRHGHTYMKTRSFSAWFDFITIVIIANYNLLFRLLGATFFIMTSTWMCLCLSNARVCNSIGHQLKTFKTRSCCLLVFDFSVFADLCTFC